MIRSFRNKGLERLATKDDASKLNVQNVGRVERILTRLDAAVSADEMDLPGWKLHALKGQDAGRHSVSVSGNWRITFAFDGEDAIDVDLEDYQ